jgi:hypothetical protein
MKYIINGGKKLNGEISVSGNEQSSFLVSLWRIA